MKKVLIICISVILACLNTNAAVTELLNEPDSAYLVAYSTNKNNNKNGLHFAWSLDKEKWESIGNEYSFLRSDFGRWGSQKRMLAPVIIQDKAGMWHCLFSLNEKDGVIAHAQSADLVNWRPQSYPQMMKEEEGNCVMIEVGYNSDRNSFFVSWYSEKEEKEKGALWGCYTSDFKHYSPAQQVPEAARVNMRTPINIAGEAQIGVVQKVSWQLIDSLIKAHRLAAYKNMLHQETTATDPIRFASLKPVEAEITISPEAGKPISDMLIGIFFEDINYAADGGIYAELVQNRGFEYAPGDRGGRDASWNSTKAWSVDGQGMTLSIETDSPIHPNNAHYALLDISRPGAALTNEGFDGIPVKKGEKYDFAMFAKMIAGKGGACTVRLVDETGKVCAQTTVKASSSDWKKQTAVLTATQTCTKARLEILPQFAGKLSLDMISLFPQQTFKGRKNGMRQDLAQVLADMKPRFVRFPGGCVAHGDGLGNMYHWKNTIGALEERKPQRNLWGYHQTAGLGYYEYFQFCEDIGAEPLPVLPAGVPCQNSGTGGHGQQCGIPMDKMPEYIQEALDLIEWANGDARKSVWGKKRAEAGHPKPFNLKYIGIGNEDLISEVFEERYVLICNAIREKYPEITVVGTVGPFCEGSDYEEGWRIATEIELPMVDEHYYNPPGWYIHNQDFYDRYDRNKSKVYLGEYAAHLPGRPNNIETALAEALHLINIERNADVVSLTSYAPLLAKEGHTQWNPDLIYFNNTEVKPTVGYYVQQLYGHNSGDEYLPNRIKLSDQSEAVGKRLAASVVKDSKTGDYILKMVNLLPVAVGTTFNPDVLVGIGANAMVTTLTGRPDDRKAKPTSQEVQVDDVRKWELPAYSFTVI